MSEPTKQEALASERAADERAEVLLDAINFAVDEMTMESDTFLRCWREGGCDEHADDGNEWADWRAYAAERAAARAALAQAPHPSDPAASRDVEAVGSPLREALEHLFEANPDKVAQALAKPTLRGWFLGQLLKAMDNEASIKDCTEAVTKAFEAMHSAPCIAELTAERDALQAEHDRVAYILYYRDFSSIGLRYPDDGLKSCIGTDNDKFQAARRLRDACLVTIEDSPLGPLVSWAKDRSRRQFWQARASAAEASVAQLGDALKRALETVVMIVAFIGRDQGTSRFEGTIKGIVAECLKRDEAIREALRHLPSADAPSSGEPS